ncbi:putative O-glycosylation ligase, exosortase A system-associated [Novosphingobium sp.]|uniref:putative O-glycosylation ligase, exosortase A system-associated n=1 Tax=Novosphingobium sp. TaxID=1874826 RepID=UPI00286B80AA|nr:putative O-glycosylation ligase, exosortase A system-associated [Novosphingobium sp.]
MLNLALTGFVLAFLALGFRRPYLWVLAYLYIDSLAPQKISWGFLKLVPISLISFLLAFGGWLLLDYKINSRFTMRQGLIALLLVYCGLTTLSADFPEDALVKWDWVWKALLFAMFLPLTLTTRLRIEAATLIMTLTVGAIVINGAIKTLAGGGGYGTLRLFVNDNSGLYEGSIISAVAISIIPLIFWLIKHGTIFPSDWRVKLYGIALAFACVLIPIGTQARTGLLCVALLMVLALRTVKRRVLYLSLIAVGVLVTIPLLPKSYTDRMNTIENHSADQSASTRVAVWKWTLEYVKEHPFGGGFDAYRGNKVRIELTDVQGTGNNVTVQTHEAFDKARAYHSAYFEMLGEQGWPGLALWLTLMFSGLLQMELIRQRWKKRTGPGEMWQAPLANALQQSLLVYMTGSLFVGIAFQPFCYMLIGLQCGLWSYLRRIDSLRPIVRTQRPALSIGNAVAAQ